MVLLLDDDFDEDEDQPYVSIVPICKIKVEPRTQPRQGSCAGLAAPAASGVSEIGSLALGVPSGAPACIAGAPLSALASIAHLNIPASSTCTAAGCSLLASSAAAGLSVSDAGPAACALSSAAGVGIVTASVHPTSNAHVGVATNSEASIPVGDLVEERENDDFIANQEDGVEEEESVEDDGGVAQVVAAEVADEVAQSKDIFQVPGGLQPLPPYIDNNP